MKFDDAKPGTLEQIKPGDQLRARGDEERRWQRVGRSRDRLRQFPQHRCDVVSADAANNTITVTDLANKRPVTLKIGSDSQMHELPAMFAQRIAMRA